MTGACLLDVQQFQVGNDIRTLGLFRNAVLDGLPFIDPSEVYVDILDPLGNEVTYQYGVDSNMGKDAPGQYWCDFFVGQSGYWKIRWWSQGLAVGSKEMTIKVVPADTYQGA